MRKKAKFKTKYKTLDVYEDDFDKIDQLCEAMGLKKCQFMKTVIEGLYDAGNQFLASPNMGMLMTYSGSHCKFNFYGEGAIIFAVGSSDEEVQKVADEEVKRRDLENE